HDCARDMELGEMITLCDSSGIRVDALRKTMPALLHGPAGAAAAESEYGIEDREILDAIYYHTTGRPGMSLLEKIIFIADHLSPERGYDGIAELRETAVKNLDTALIEAMAGTISYVAAKGLPIHTDMVEARNCLLAKCVKNGINDGKNK
ncbi:MAG: bis(5'-nucleosyl)-tetraphosphatase (symmetrical) YqeK, partial [Eubacteriales bacterium]|nr:bis(5'-nucleosyl)-tetraphosphatase (symmetrical) YqeK [Eubacteriales bacterium]